MDGDALDLGRNGGPVQSAPNADGDGDNWIIFIHSNIFDYVFIKTIKSKNVLWD